MLTSYAVVIAGVVGVMLLWIAGQSAWRRVFPEACSDPDVLAGRAGCGGCDRGKVCSRRRSGTSEEAT